MASRNSLDDEDERGFLFLEECEVFLDVPSGRIDEVQTFQWRSVEIPPCHLSEETKATSSSDCCMRCNLALHEPVQQNGSLPPLKLTGIVPRFDGTMADVKPDPNECGCRVRQRSDAALLIGLAFTCQDLGHVVIRSIQVILLRDEGNLEDKRLQPDAARVVRKKRVGLIVTVAIPEVSNVQAKRSNSNSSNRRFISSSSKPLPPCTQLLLSVLRSDWDNLERIVKDPEKLMAPHMVHGRELSFFPPKLSLDEVYHRIGAAASGVDVNKMLVAGPYQSKVSLLDLPKDILEHKIASYLRARSLDTLRCSCKYLHQTLRSVVPGLKLKLYAHQVKSLAWMRQRETQRIKESEFTIQASHNLHRFVIGDECDPHRAASGGASVLLSSRRNRQDLRISQYTGDEIIVRSDDPLSRNVARGGLLCDDPGLGKTITVLSLILQTLGLGTVPVATKKSNDELVAEEDNDERIFVEYWREQVVPEFRCRALHKFLSSFLRTSSDVDYFFYPVDPENDECPDYFDVIRNPICFKDIQRKVNAHQYRDSFQGFRSDVELCFSNAMLYNPPGNPVHDAAVKLRRVFSEMTDDFMMKQVQVAKKSFARASSKPNSSVAALVERTNHIKLINSLTPSAGTLLVVPFVLLEHWQEQLRLHIDLAYVSNKFPIVFEYTGGCDVFHSKCDLRMKEILHQCKSSQTHFPFIFVDQAGTKKLPDPSFLAMFSVVITTNQRFTNEWSHGSFADELKRESHESYDDGQDMMEYRTSLANSDEACPLLKVNWLRMIVDEGHSMGRGKDNSAISFASWIAAERSMAFSRDVKTAKPFGTT